MRRDESGASVELTDEVKFATGPGTFESVLTTFGEAEVSPNSVLLRGVRGALRVFVDPEAVEPRIGTLEDVDLAEGPADVRRVFFAFLEPAREGSVHLRIEPESG